MSNSQASSNPESSKVESPSQGVWVQIRPGLSRLTYPKSKIRAHKNLLGPVAKAFSEGGLTLEHANVEGEGPITFTSRQQLRDHMNKHKLQSGALL